MKKLRAGSRVLIKPEEVFDYVYDEADGTEGGNETGRLIERGPSTPLEVVARKFEQREGDE